MLLILSKLKIPFAVLLLAAAFVSGWVVRDWKDADARADQLTKTIIQAQESQQVSQQVSRSYHSKSQAFVKKNNEVNHEIQAEVSKNPVYDTCTIPANGLRILTYAVRSSNQAKSPLRTDD